MDAKTGRFKAGVNPLKEALTLLRGESAEVAGRQGFTAELRSLLP